MKQKKKITKLSITFNIDIDKTMNFYLENKKELDEEVKKFNKQFNKNANSFDMFLSMFLSNLIDL